MFNRVLAELQEENHFKVTTDPASCTQWCRKFVLSMWIGWLDHQLKRATEAYHRIEQGRNPETIQPKLWADNRRESSWQDDIFSGLIFEKLNTEYWARSVVENMKALGLDPNGMRRRTRIAKEWECEEWKSVLHKARLVKQVLVTITDS